MALLDPRNLLRDVDDRLVSVLTEASKDVDIVVIEGSRSFATQVRYVKEGVSKTMKSGHLVEPKAKAVDVIPSVDRVRGMRTDHPKFMFSLGLIMGAVLAAARHLGNSEFDIRFGYDFNGNKILDDKFFDGAHIEIKNYATEPDTRFKTN